MAKQGIATDKARCWKEFSQMIRVLHCLETTGIPFVGVCVTCGKRFHIWALQAGHCFAGRQNGVLFMRKFVKGQCVICNERHHGLPKVFRAYVDNLYGVDFVERQIPRMKRNYHDRTIDFDGRAKRYKRITDIALRKHGYKTYREMCHANK